MFHRIMIPLDGSQFAEAVLPLAGALARAYDVDVVLLRAAPAGLYLGTDYAGADDGIVRPAVDYLEHVARRPALGGLRVTTVVAGGAPAEVIVDEAHRRGVDLIAMATHGRGGVARLALGSVADQVLHSFAGSLLVVRPDAGDIAADDHPRRVVVPLDGSALAATAIDLAVELAERIEAEVKLTIVLGIHEPVVSEDHRILIHVDELLAGDHLVAEQYLAGLAASVRERGVPVSWEVRVGEVAPQIRAVAMEVPGSMVVMTTHGRSGVDRLIRGSIADEMVRGSHVPVLMRRPLERIKAPQVAARYETAAAAR